ncbi:hypothetical protein [Roseobacter sinensis]|uniref:Uncharacterized protein n=1 Tax=Roseobacter sinensis TaxID=2931391 RepID=A0ABT3BIH0_9RHOB|nr:hypothetical protein [Roseobacter sp. WL0113]MCV3273370.1 hypothetical protein [Roseobacter sp. WL0113]
MLRYSVPDGRMSKCRARGHERRFERDEKVGRRSNLSQKYGLAALKPLGNPPDALILFHAVGYSEPIRRNLSLLLPALVFGENRR